MNRHLQAIALSATLLLPMAALAQDRDDRDRRQTEQQARHFEDRAHHDSHEWNEAEDRAYRRYLDEHHRHYVAFDRASRKQQENYWKWRHEHLDADHERH